jgi:uncharacterized protein (TIGR02996 family)
VTEEDAFLHDIIEHPDDDAPRLVFADWLDERARRGDADRAEFIRLQCRLATLPWDDPERPALQQREAVLLAHHGNHWAGPVAKLAKGREFARGFVEKVSLGAGDFLDRADELFRLAPVCMAILSEVEHQVLRRLVACPHLARLRGLAAHGSMRAAGARALAQSPHLVNLRGLDVNDNPIGHEGLEAIMNSRSLPHLTHLALGACRVGSVGAHMLAGSEWSTRLRALDLRGNDLEAADLRQLIESPHLKGLYRLGLWYNKLRDEGASALAESTLLGQLGHLSIGNNRFGPDAIKAFASSPQIVNLQVLWLGVDSIGDEAALELACSPYLHPQAFIALWFEAGLTDPGRAGLMRLREDRVSLKFDSWEKDALVDWPLWRP